MDIGSSRPFCVDAGDVHSSNVIFITLPESISWITNKVQINVRQISRSLQSVSLVRIDIAIDLLRRAPFTLSLLVGVYLAMRCRGDLE